MKLRLLIVLVACLSCLVTPVWSIGLFKKAGAVMGAAKGAAFLGAGVLAAKKAVLKDIAAKKVAMMKPILQTQEAPSCETKPNLQIPFKPVSQKYSYMLDKISKIMNLFAAMKTKKKSVPKFMDPMEPPKYPVVYKIVPVPNFYFLPVEEKITIEK